MSAAKGRQAQERRQVDRQLEVVAGGADPLVGLQAFNTPFQTRQDDKSSCCTCAMCMQMPVFFCVSVCVLALAVDCVVQSYYAVTAILQQSGTSHDLFKEETQDQLTHLPHVHGRKEEGR